MKKTVAKASWNEYRAPVLLMRIYCYFLLLMVFEIYQE
jgi:hypothetical protein